MPKFVAHKNQWSRPSRCSCATMRLVNFRWPHVLEIKKLADFSGTFENPRKKPSFQTPHNAQHQNVGPNS